jgi:anti-sigma B factor antagonist
MALSFQTRTVGDVAVVKCDGRIVEGPESLALRQHVDDVLRIAPAIVLQLEGIEYIDSSGLGLLVRILSRTGHGNLKFCAVPARIAEMFRITRLAEVFESHASEADAIAAFYRRPTVPTEPSRLSQASVLCVEKSGDLLSYLRELLRQAGVSVIAADNLPDAVILLKATTPKVVVMSRELRTNTSTRAAETFNGLVHTLPVVELPADFATGDPSETGRQLLDRVLPLLGSSSGKA